MQTKHALRSTDRALRCVGNVLLVLSLLLFVWVTGGAVAYGWILHADSYGAAFAAYGRLYFAAAGLMTLAAVCYFVRLDLPAAAMGGVSYVTMLLLLLKAIGIAEKNGWAGQTEQSFARTAASVWRSGMMWDFIPLLLLLLLTLTRFFSYEASVQRAQKKNASAPSILADDAEFGGQKSTPADIVRQKVRGNDRSCEK